MNHTTQLLTIIQLMLASVPMYKRVMGAVHEYADLVGSTDEDMIREIAEFVRSTSICTDIVADEDIFASLAQGLAEGPCEPLRDMVTRHAEAHGMGDPTNANLHFAVLHCAMSVIIAGLIAVAPDVEKAITETDEDAPAPAIGEDGSLENFQF